MATGDPRPPSQAEWAAALPLNAPPPEPWTFASPAPALHCGTGKPDGICLVPSQGPGAPACKREKGEQNYPQCNPKNSTIKFLKTAFADPSPDPQILFNSPSRFLHLTRHPTLTFRPFVFPLQGYIFVTGNANFFPFPMRASVKW